MYIPINFLASNQSCGQIEISGSNFDTTTTAFGVVNSGSDNAHFWIRCDNQESLTFNISGGSVQSKLLLVGGGGYSEGFNVNPLNPSDSSTGGGGAGEVVFKDINLQPGITYFMSSSAIGGRSTSQIGGESTFIENYVADPIYWIQHTVVGGDSNTNQTGGDSGNGFTGGSGIGSGTISAGGGGAGSTADGQDA